MPDLIEYEILHQEGVRYMRIPTEEAFRIRFDVQLYWLDGARIVMEPGTPSTWRNEYEDDRRIGYEAEATSVDSLWWRDTAPFYILVDPTKPEYEPHDSPNPS